MLKLLDFISNSISFIKGLILTLAGIVVFMIGAFMIYHNVSLEFYGEHVDGIITKMGIESVESKSEDKEPAFLKAAIITYEYEGKSYTHKVRGFELNDKVEGDKFKIIFGKNRPSVAYTKSNLSAGRISILIVFFLGVLLLAAGLFFMNAHKLPSWLKMKFHRKPNRPPKMPIAS